MALRTEKLAHLPGIGQFVAARIAKPGGKRLDASALVQFALQRRNESGVDAAAQVGTVCHIGN